MKKVRKQYLILGIIISAAIFLAARELMTPSFVIIKNSHVTKSEQKTGSQKVNINSADITALSSLHGIGKSLAQRIIDYRTEHGSFEVIYDIMKVSGIGDKTFEEIKDYITVNQEGY